MTLGVLTDGPAPTRHRGGQGDKFIRIYRSLDAEDQARIREWDGDPGDPNYGGVSHIWRKLAEHFDIGYTAVENGVKRLRGSKWEC
jgi:hypothetical protein